VTIATTREELKAEIRAAFGSIAFPSHQGLRGSMAMDRYASVEQVKSITAGEDVHGEWWQIPREELWNSLLALSYLDAAGVLFYLPAYLEMALDDVGKRRLLVLYLINTAVDDDEPGHRAYLERRLSLLNGAQRRVCVRVLWFLRSQLVEDPSTQYERDLIDRALQDPYWRKE
jgi:hypothetical protein